MICSDWSLFQCVSILAVRMVKIAQVSERSPLDGAARQEWSRPAAQTLKVKATSLSWSPALRGLLSKPRGGGRRTGVRESPNKIAQRTAHAVAENFRERYLAPRHLPGPE